MPLEAFAAALLSNMAVVDVERKEYAFGGGDAQVNGDDSVRRLSRTSTTSLAEMRVTDRTPKQLRYRGAMPTDGAKRRET